jgi:hypothetical protein
MRYCYFITIEMIEEESWSWGRTGIGLLEITALAQQPQQISCPTGAV